MEKEGVIGLGTVDEPSHSLDDVRSSRFLPGIVLVVRQADDITLLVSPMSREEILDVLNIVDTSPQFALLANIVDADLRQEVPHEQSRFLRGRTE